MSDQVRYNGKCRCGQRLSLTKTAVSPRDVEWVTCPESRDRVMLRKIEGTYNPDHPCDARCTSAHGHICRCSCGGANHGADHGIQEVVAVEAKQRPEAERLRAVELELRQREEMEQSAYNVERIAELFEEVKRLRSSHVEPAPAAPIRRKSQFIGEVGERITVEVRVVRGSKISNGSTLYTFKTPEGDFLKWFAPDYADPEWEPNKKLTIKGKIKKHDAFGGINCTHLTYVEEV